jgi:hypothetical protein
MALAKLPRVSLPTNSDLPTISKVDALIALRRSRSSSGSYVDNRSSSDSDVDDAKIALERVQKEFPTSSELHRCWADYYLAEGQVILAEEHAKNARFYDPDNLSAVAALAECYSRQRRKNYEALRLVHPIAETVFNLRIMKLYCKLAAKGFGKKNYLALYARYDRSGDITLGNAQLLSLTRANDTVNERQLRDASSKLDPGRLVARTRV